jgi:hypothetical protein
MDFVSRRMVILEQAKMRFDEGEGGARGGSCVLPACSFPGWSGLAGSAAELQPEAENGSTRGLKNQATSYSARSRFSSVAAVNDLTSPPSP